MSIADEISKLSALKDKGIITEQEFNEAKKKFLSSDSSNTPQVDPKSAPIKYKGPPYECWNCGGRLIKSTESSNSGSGCIIVILGIVLTPLIIGIFIIIYGLHHGSKRKGIWKCKKCDSVFPRTIKWYELG